MNTIERLKLLKTIVEGLERDLSEHQIEALFSGGGRKEFLATLDALLPME